MTKLVWGSSGDRVFELGADRGVLYVNGGSLGVPWNGLIAVKESPSGGEPRPYYLDGFKYINLTSSEEFSASIDAYSAPPEFAACDGTRSISNGLFATQQPRTSFGLSYRTTLGNDTNGQDHGYKVHLVYNALAAPSSRDNNTISDSPEPIEFSWSISTMAPEVAAIKPTAHFVVDSTKTPLATLAALSDMLYGTDATNAYLPTPAELIALFA